jgi:Protein of unknown function (DUF3383)
MSIPASAFVQVIPGVLGAGAPPLAMSGLFVTEDPSIPIGTVQSFGDAVEVADWFGPTSNQAYLAGIYFNGYNGCTQLPGNLLFVQYNANAVGAYLRGVQNTPLTLTQLEALSGTISINVNGTVYTSNSINLSGSGTFSGAASLIQTGLTGGGAPVTVTWDALRDAFVIASTTTGTGSTIAYPTDSSLSPALYLTQATGAVLSQGAAAATAASVMNTVIGLTTNWAAFTTDWLPTLAIMEAFASWVTIQNAQFVYVPYDNAPAVLTGTDSASLGAITADYTGVCPIWNPAGDKAAFILGAIASINFQATGGRITFAFKGQGGLTPDITSLAAYQNLIANHYNAYVSVASQTEQFQWFQNGQVSGSWDWLDSYVNQIYFNGAFKGALLSLLSSVNSIPYNTGGFGLVASALQPVINQMLAFGAAVAGGELSPSQAAAVNAQTTVNAAQSIENYGYYLSVTAPSATVEQARGSPDINFFYWDGNSVQSIIMSSVDVE